MPTSGYSNWNYSNWNWVAIHPPVFGFGGQYRIGTRFGADGHPDRVRLELGDWAQDFEPVHGERRSTMTSKERREVAERLRLIDWNQYIYPDDELMDLCVCLDADLEKLADLIDPTCEIVTDQVDDGEWGAHDIYECCSNCGNQNMRDKFTGKPHRYCPNCGARVTSGGER